MIAGNNNAEIKGLDQFPIADQPPVIITHIAFQAMVALGMAMLGNSLVYFLIYGRNGGSTVTAGFSACLRLPPPWALWPWRRDGRLPK